MTANVMSYPEKYQLHLYCAIMNMESRGKKFLQLCKKAVVRVDDSDHSNDEGNFYFFSSELFTSFYIYFFYHTDPFHNSDNSNDKSDSPSENELDSDSSGPGYKEHSPEPEPSEYVANNEIEKTIAGPQRENVPDESFGSSRYPHQYFEYTGPDGVDQALYALMKDSLPHDFFLLFIDHDIISNIVDQTNLYATQKVLQVNDVPSTSRLRAWEPVTKSEMMRCIGLIGYMGLVKMPSISDYWS
jgi:hypothetical protein